MFKIVGLGMFGVLLMILLNAMVFGFLIMIGWGIVYHETDAINSTISFWPATGLGFILSLVVGALRGGTN